jgi:hypothetical protein
VKAIQNRKSSDTWYLSHAVSRVKSRSLLYAISSSSIHSSAHVRRAIFYRKTPWEGNMDFVKTWIFRHVFLAQRSSKDVFCVHLLLAAGRLHVVMTVQKTLRTCKLRRREKFYWGVYSQLCSLSYVPAVRVWLNANKQLGAALKSILLLRNFLPYKFISEPE